MQKKYECVLCFDTEVVMTDRGPTTCPDCGYVLVGGKSPLLQDLEEKPVQQAEVIPLRTGLRLVEN